MMLYAFSSLPGAPSLLPLLSILLVTVLQLKTDSREDGSGNFAPRLLAALSLALSYRLFLAAATAFHVRTQILCSWPRLFSCGILPLSTTLTRKKSKTRRRSPISWPFRWLQDRCQPSLAPTRPSTSRCGIGHRYSILLLPLLFDPPQASTPHPTPSAPHPPASMILLLLLLLIPPALENPSPHPRPPPSSRFPPSEQ